MNINTIVNICAGILLAKLTIGIINESYRFKWQRVRMELKRLQRCCKRQKKEVKVSHQGKKRSEGSVPLVQNTRRSQAAGKHTVPQKRCAFPRFFDPPN